MFWMSHRKVDVETSDLWKLLQCIPSKYWVIGRGNIALWIITSVWFRVITILLHWINFDFKQICSTVTGSVMIHLTFSSTEVPSLARPLLPRTSN